MAEHFHELTVAEVVPETDEALLKLEDALQKLEKTRPDWAKIAVLKYYGGLTNQEVADAMGTSLSSVERYWAAARALLYKHIVEAP